MREATVVIPVYRARPDHNETISLRQCISVLGSHPITFVAPLSLDLSNYLRLLPDAHVEYFPRRYFAGINGYNRLLTSPWFYQRFLLYEFILIYQLDAFVFRDELADWCTTEYDFIGAPWFEGYAYADEASLPIGVGNGGFSLRRVSSFLKALYSLGGLGAVEVRFSGQNAWPRKVAGCLSLAMQSVIRSSPYYILSETQRNEDGFWGFYITRTLKWFKTAPLKVAASFSAEVNPRLVYELNLHTLPFGCHAWRKHDYAFWQPYIRKCGHTPE